MPLLEGLIGAEIQRNQAIQNRGVENVSGPDGSGAGPGLLNANEEPVVETSTGKQISSQRPLTLQERYNEFVLPKERRKLGQFLGERADIRRHQQTAQFGRNEELADRLGVGQTGVGQALHSAASARAGEANARDETRARGEFDQNIQAFRQNELNRLMTPVIDPSVQQDAIIRGIFEKGVNVLTSAANMGSGGGSVDLGSSGDILGGLQKQQKPGVNVQGGLSSGGGGALGGGGLDTLGQAFAARGGGGFGVLTPGQEEEERRRRAQARASRGFPES